MTEQTHTNPIKEYAGDMRSFEKEYYIDSEKPWIVRLDGHKFSKFTKKFKTPFDDRIHRAMVTTCLELMKTFSPSTIFTCSDEITMVFPSLNSKDTPEHKRRTLINGGKIQKITSLSAGLASSVFTLAIRELCKDDEIMWWIDKTNLYFDARVVQLSSDEAVTDNIVWRCLDFKRNSVTMVALTFFSLKQLHKVSTTKKLEMLENENYDWHDLPMFYRYGTFIKKKRYPLRSDDGSEVLRSRSVEVHKMVDKVDPSTIEFVMSKCIEYNTSC